MYQFSFIFPSILVLVSFSGTTIAKNCESSPGWANGECVTYYSQQGCHDNNYLGSYKPTSSGNCFQYDSFFSVRAVGDGTYGTDCKVYSDYNCQNQVADTGNQIGGNWATNCASVAQGKSMKCWYRA